MRAVWTLVLALCLAGTSAVRAPQLDELRARRAAEDRVAGAPDAVPDAVAARRRAGPPVARLQRAIRPLPDRGLSPLAILVAPFVLVPPRTAAIAPSFAVTTCPARPRVSPRTSRGPPPG